MRTISRRSVITASLVLAAVTAVQAGGWSIITLNDYPDYAEAGTPLTLTFSVRQHGSNLLSGLEPVIHASAAGGLEVVATATPTTHEGEYSATLRLTAPDDWTLRVDGGFNPGDTTRQYNSVVLPPLSVIHDGAMSPAYSETERGGRLFVTKGCVGCHSPGSDRDLTQKHLATGYLKTFLVNPSIRTENMPNLKLKESEISALIAFINGARSSSTRNGS